MLVTIPQVATALLRGARSFGDDPPPPPATPARTAADAGRCSHRRRAAADCHVTETNPEGDTSRAAEPAGTSITPGEPESQGVAELVPTHGRQLQFWARLDVVLRRQWGTRGIQAAHRPSGGIGLVVDRPVSEARLGIQQMAPSGLVWIVLKVRSDSPEPFRWRLLGFGTQFLRQTESQGGSVQLTKPETVRTLGIAFNGGQDGFLAAEIQKFGGVELDAPVQVLLDGEAQPEKAANGSLALDGGTYRADAISATAGRMVGGTPTMIGQVHTAGGGTVLLFDDSRDVHWIAPDPVLVSADLVLDPDYEFTSSSPQAINPSASFPFNVFQSWREQSPPPLTPQRFDGQRVMKT